MGAQQADGLSQAEPVSRLGPSGFDPSRGDAEMLAILMWDYFGPYDPRTPLEIQAQSFKASEIGIAKYRECAEQIGQSLSYYRGIKCRACNAAIHRRRRATARIGVVG